jgi:hypothetical protein
MVIYNVTGLILPYGWTQHFLELFLSESIMFKFTHIIIIILITTSCVIPSALAGNCPVGDISGDCKVGISDLMILSNYWLDVPDCLEGGCPDIIGESVVDFHDFAVIAANWQKQGYPLVINEYMSDNENTIEDPDETGAMPDWIEIYNYGPEPIDLAGMFVSDNQSLPLKWMVSSGNPVQTTVPAGGYLIIWADEDPSQGPTHAGFKLSNKGDEYIGLYVYENN